MRKTVFIRNAVILTASSLLLRLVGIFFKVWLANLIGSEGIGLYQLVFSVYILAATFATTGICTAVTRLIADELALGSRGGIQKILFHCLLITLLLAVISALLVYCGSDFIAVSLLGDARAAPALRILVFSLPFMGISSCLRGYFIARRKASPTAISQLTEQAVRIVLVVYLVQKFYERGIAFTCAAVLFGDVAAEFISAFLLWLLWNFDQRRINSLQGRKRPPYGVIKEIMRISVPITAGRYLNTALRTVENILVPKNLSKFGSGNALAQFGMIKGMALPILFFPSTLLNALTTLLIPEMSEASARKQTAIVRSTVTKILRITSLISIFCGALFFTGGRQIGSVIYKSDDVGFLLCALSPIVPLMYLDSVSDGILKGLDQQLFTFRTGVCDSALRILLIVLILPQFGLYGFLGIMYASNLLTCALNVVRLLHISGVKPNLIYHALFPISAALTVTLLLQSILRCAGQLPDLLYLLLLCGGSVPLYFLALYCTGCIEKDEIAAIFDYRRKKIVKKKITG